MHPEILSRVEAFQRWQFESKWKPEKCEMRVFHSRHDYGGTLDQFGQCEGDRFCTLLEIKATAEQDLKRTGWQSSAYLEAYRSMMMYYKPVRRLGLFLNPNLNKVGYVARELNDPDDFNVFKAALYCYRAKRG
jgi:hypothetical protein